MSIVNTLHIAALTAILEGSHPFLHNLGIRIVKGSDDHAGVMIACHGYSGNGTIAQRVQSAGVVTDHVIGFNFIDHDFDPETYDYTNTMFGTTHEALPLLYVIKRCVIDLSLSAINLYGFSAGGGAIIGALALLNTTQHDDLLTTLGITQQDKQKIIAALARGHIVLDCPLKSIEEIIFFRGTTPELTYLAERSGKSRMCPITLLEKLQGMHLNILLHFQEHDEILGNRDDMLFVDRLKRSVRGKLEVIIGNDGGHLPRHTSLWQEYPYFRSLCTA